MRRLVAALVALVLGVSLTVAVAGCGSSSTSSSTSTAPAAVPVPAGGSSSVLPPIVNRSANDTDTFIAFPTSGTIPPELVQKVVQQKTPTIIYFYDSTQEASKEVRTIIDTVRAENRGMVDLVAYDIGKYLTADAQGNVAVDEALSKDPIAQAAVKLARDPAIDVTYTPFIVVTDGQGYIIYKHMGLVDRAFLEREVLRAAR